MADYLWKKVAGLIVLLLAVCMVMIFGKKEGLGRTADALELESTTQITKVSFRETFGQSFEVEIIATEKEILY